MEKDNQFAQRLVEYRKAAELKQKEAAELAGISVSSLCHWEHGISKPSTEDLEKLLAVYNEKISLLHPGYVPVVVLPPLTICNAIEIGKFCEDLKAFDGNLHDFLEYMTVLCRSCQ